MAKITQAKVQGWLSLIAALVPVVATVVKAVKGKKTTPGT